MKGRASEDGKRWSCKNLGIVVEVKLWRIDRRPKEVWKVELLEVEERVADDEPVARADPRPGGQADGGDEHGKEKKDDFEDAPNIPSYGALGT